MDIIQYIIEIYGGYNLQNRETRVAPVIMAIQESMQLCFELAQYQQPLKAIFIRDDGEKLEYKNRPYLEMEKSKGGT